MDTNAHSAKGRLLTVWTPEDKRFWETQGRAIADQNLWLSIPALFLAFAVWMVWSAVVTQLPAVGLELQARQCELQQYLRGLQQRYGVRGLAEIEAQAA